MAEPRTDQAYVESHESEFLTPLEQVKSVARTKIFDVENALKGAGVTDTVIQSAAEINVKNAAMEFEAKQAEDPIRRMIGVLETSAVSGKDQEIIDFHVKNVERQRTAWKNVIDTEKTRARMQGKEFSFEDTVRNTVRYNMAPTFSKFVDYEPTIFFDLINTTRLTSEQTPGHTTNEQGRPSDECLNKILKGLGSLQPDDKIGDLYMLPQQAPEGKPSMVSGADKVQNLPTFLPDAKVDFFFKGNRVMVGIGVKALEKIVAFPASV